MKPPMAPPRPRFDRARSAAVDLRHQPIIRQVPGPGNFLDGDLGFYRFKNPPRDLQKMVHRKKNDYRSLAIGSADDSDFFVGFEDEFDVCDMLRRCNEIDRDEFHRLISDHQFDVPGSM